MTKQYACWNLFTIRLTVSQPSKADNTRCTADKFEDGMTIRSLFIAHFASALWGMVTLTFNLSTIKLMVSRITLSTNFELSMPFRSYIHHESKTCSSILKHNFDEFWPILEIASLLDSAINFQQCFLSLMVLYKCNYTKLQIRFYSLLCVMCCILLFYCLTDFMRINLSK